MSQLKSYVITLDGVEGSDSLATDCINSAAQFGLTVDRFHGVHGVEDIERTMKHLNIRPYSPKMKKKRLGVKGCFLSHYLLWLQCVNNNETLVIFEQDGFLLRSIPNDIENKFDEFLVLDPFDKFNKFYKNSHQASSKNRQEVVDYYYLSSKKKYGVESEYPCGLQSYIIKPAAAEKLIKEVNARGFRPADMQCNKDIIHLETVKQSIASVNPRYYDNSQLMKEQSTTRNL